MTFKIIKPPTKMSLEAGSFRIFLAGSIDMGMAFDWQKEIEEQLSDLSVTILNPRRNEWDASWVQDISNPVFTEQVVWELDGLDAVDLIVFVFDKNGKAPISLLELGLYAKSGKCLVHCPEGYWRRGNVQIVCDRFAIPMIESFDELVKLVRNKVTETHGA